MKAEKSEITQRVPAALAGTPRHPGVRRAGFNLIELVVALMFLGVLAGLGAPRMIEWSRGLRIELAAAELSGVLRQARSAAVRHGTKVGVKFWPDPDGRVSFTLHRDADGDGVRTNDILSGIDPPLAPPRELEHLGRGVGFGFPPGPAPSDPGDPSRRLARLHDPIRFNRSDIASFNHLGGSTPGSLYLTDGVSRLAVVRVFGRTGKVRILEYDRSTDRWS